MKIIKFVPIGAYLLAVIAASALPAEPMPNVTIIGVPCAATRQAYALNTGSAPSIYLDKTPGPLGYVRETIKKGPTFVTISLYVATGFHLMGIVSPYGSNAVVFDVVAGHKRTITVPLCNWITSYDPARSVSVLLPFEGLTPYLIRHHEGISSIEPMSIEDGVAYAASIGPGSLELVVSYTSSSTPCRFLLDGSTDGAATNFRFRLAAAALAMSNKKGQCGSLESL